MNVVKCIFLAVILIGCFHTIKVMGGCRFHKKFRCKDKEGSQCFKKPGYNRQDYTTKLQAVQSTTRQTSLNHSTPGTVTADLEFTSHSPTGQVITGFATTDGVITTTPSCPLNMVLANCTTCQSTCSDPKNCIASNCTVPEACVCPDGLLLKGGDCVTIEECQCFVEGEGVIPEGEFKVSPNCSQRCSCTGGKLTCNDTYQCSLNAVCEERNALLRCYCAAGFTGDGIICSPIVDCQDVYNRVSIESGVYQIKPITWQGEPFDVYCDMTNGGGWTVFQRRVNGSQDFSLSWSEYKVGFGTPDHEVWLGNDKLHSLTTQKNYKLRIDIVNRLGNPYFAEYSSFRISDEKDKYQLTLGSFSGGDAGDSLTAHHDRFFTTYDRDNDIWDVGNCATDIANGWCPKCTFNGGWWYKSCIYSPLNNLYGSNCFGWRFLPEGKCNITYTEMKLRPIC